MKKKLISICLVAIIAITAIAGASLAYLTDTDDAVNTMTLGKVKIKQHEYQRVTENDKYVTDTVDGQTSYVLEMFEQEKNILPVVGDPSLPSNNPGYAGWDNTPVRMSQVDSYGGMQVFAGMNFVDKFVTVENTGSIDAYVRTLIAIECGSFTAEKFDELVGISFHSTWTKNDIGIISVEDNNYYLLEFVYAGGQLSDGTWRHENGVLPARDTTYPNLAQVYLASAATNEDCEDIDGNKNGTLDILVISQAVQAAGFADAKTALDAAFGATADKAAGWIGDIYFNAPADDDELKDDLQGNENTIVVNLTGDMTYDVAAWQNEAMGGTDTEKVVINGNGHTITFNNTNSDWNNIVTNGATLVINDAIVNNAGHDATSGTWNAHDINFGCKVEFNNVTFLNAVAVGSDATFNNVNITDDSTGDAYMLWIRANGQTVVLNGCEIDALGTDGSDRGIKIDSEYIDAPAKVTLTVKDTVFKTEKKAAILVDSTAGADITLENIDISGVAADTTNAVWVDGDSAAYASLVTVTGGNVIVEP